MPRCALTSLIILGLALLFPPLAAAQAAPVRPNFVILVVDDAGLMDFGAYGGEARTPTIDALAARGVLFGRYRTSPLCSPSRAMLLTGVDNHRTGLATIPEVLPRAQRGQPGYEMRLNPQLHTLAERLREMGYRTYMAGKWHLGAGRADLPNHHGFDRSFALEASGADNWAHKSYMPYYASAPWYEDGRPVRRPEGPHSSTLIIDRMIRYLSEAGGQDQSRPFLAYIGFQAVHIPVQAPAALTATYAETYTEGWEALRQRRWQRAQSLGLAPAGAPVPAPALGTRPWASLTPAEQALSSRSMAVYAAMIEHMDQEIGRLVAHLQTTGALDNTVFVLTSDNGPEPSDPGAQTGFPTWMATHGYRRTLEGLGEAGSHNWIGPEWAEAVATPGRLFKFYATEGGVRVPLVIAGPGVRPGQRSDANAFVTDITPTLLALAGAPPAPAEGLDGRSLVPILTGQATTVYGTDAAIGIEVSGNRALIEGPLKLLTVPPPYGDGSWKLFDVVADPGETQDLSLTRPADKARLLAAYEAYAVRNGVLPMPEGYQAERQVVINSLKRQAERYGPLLAGFLVLLVGAVVLLRRRRRGRAKPAG